MATATKSTLNKSLKKVSTIRFAPSLNGKVSLAVGTNWAGEVADNCYVTFSQPSTSSTADPYQIQYKVIYKYTAANKKKYGADYNYTFDKVSWKNAVKFGTTELGSTRNPDEWLVANRKVNTAGTKQSILNLKGTKLASGYVAAVYRFRIRTFNKATKKHGSWVESLDLTINRAADISQPALHVHDSLLVGFNLKWDMGGTFNVTSVKVGGTEILETKQYGMKLTTVTTRTSSTHPPKPGTGYTGYNASIPMSAFKPGGFELLDGASKATMTAYWETEQGVITYFKSSKAAEITIYDEDAHVEEPRLVIDAYPDIGFIIVNAYKGEASDNVAKITSKVTSTNESGKSVTLDKAYEKGELSSMSDTSPYMFGYFLPLNRQAKVSVSVYDASTGGKATTDMTIELPTKSMFMVGTKRYAGGVIATLYGNPELSRNSTQRISTYECFGRKTPVVAFGKTNVRKLTLKGIISKKMTSEEVSATGYHDANATVEQWRALAETAETCVFRTPHGEMRDVAVESVDASYIDEHTANLTVTMVEV